MFFEENNPEMVFSLPVFAYVLPMRPSVNVDVVLYTRKDGNSLIVAASHEPCPVLRETSANCLWCGV